MLSHSWTFWTVADWIPATPPTCEIDFISASGSRYVYTSEGVYRYSDHWGRVATCLWTLAGQSQSIDGWAFCPWSEFRHLIALSCGRRASSLKSGERVTALHSPKDRRGQSHPARILLTVERVTDSFIIANGNRRFAKSTISSVFSA